MSNARRRAATCTTTEDTVVLKIDCFQANRILQPARNQEFTESKSAISFQRDITREGEQLSKKMSRSSSFNSFNISVEVPPKMKSNESDELNKKIQFLQTFDFFSNLTPK